ncbi:MAG: ATP-binding protein [Clostridia bacterium]|nr:ATP-binding protein [Clostridia bacterium]
MRISKAIRQEYDQKRRRVIEERDERVRAAYALSPALRKIDEARKQAIFDLGRARMSEGGEDSLPYVTALERLETERNAELDRLGLPRDLYTPRFACVTCEDTGLVGSATKTLCSCMRQRILRENFSNANLRGDERFENFREDIFPDEKQRRGTAKVRDACAAYAEGFPNEGKGILLYGESGLGKSFLLNCIAHRVIERGYSVLNQTAYKLIADVMGRISARERPDDYTLPDLLIIDDLGTEPAMGDVSVNTLFSLLNERQSLKRPTLFASNLDPARIRALYGERMYSRIVSPRLTTVYELKGADLRLRP